MEGPSEKPVKPKVRSRIWVNLALSLASTMLCLLAIEIGLRIVRSRQAPVTLDELEERRKDYEGREVSLGHIVTASENPRLVYELIPNLRVTWWGIEVRTNASGFRDDEFATRKPADTIRIAVLGDSSAFGWKVKKEDTYADALESILNRLSGGPRFDVMNFGVPGYNTAMEREVLRARALPFDPDVVVLHFGANDMDLPNFVKKPVNHWKLDRCYLWDLISPRRSWRSDRRGTASETGPLGLADVEMTKDERGIWRFTMDPARIPPELAGMVGEANCKTAIRDIKRTCSEHDIPAVFVLDPFLLDHYSETNRAIHDPLFAAYAETARAAGFAVADPSLRIREFMDAHGLVSRDLWVEPRAFDGHPSPPRLSMMALRIAEVMLENDMLPAAAIDPAKRQQLRAAFLERAALQWSRMGRGKAPRLGDTAVTILPVAPDREETHLGEGWYGREVNPKGEIFRWCAPRARLRLPPFKRLVIEVGTDKPQDIGPPDHALFLDGRPLEYRFTRRNGRAWFDLAVPGNAMRERPGPVDLTIQCKPADLSDIPEPQRRPLGLQIFRITIEPL